MLTNSKPNVTNVQTSLFCNNAVSRTSFNYEGNKVDFRLTESVMLNATQMAKPFGKKPSKWLELTSTKQFLAALVASKAMSEKRTLNSTEGVAINSVYHSYYGGLVIGQHGGANPGTWMHEDVAIEFARWLNPKFAIWCNDRIKEILRGGKPLPVPVKQTKAPKQIKSDLSGEIKRMISESHNRNNNAMLQYSSYSSTVEKPVSIENFYWSDKISDVENLKKLLDVLEANTNAAYYMFYKNRQLIDKLNKCKELSKEIIIISN